MKQELENSPLVGAPICSASQHTEIHLLINQLYG